MQGSDLTFSGHEQIVPCVLTILLKTFSHLRDMYLFEAKLMDNNSVINYTMGSYS